jgi:hypothetical protein
MLSALRRDRPCSGWPFLVLKAGPFFQVFAHHNLLRLGGRQGTLSDRSARKFATDEKGAAPEQVFGEQNNDSENLPLFCESSRT